MSSSNDNDLLPRQSRTCNHCKARKVRCNFQAGTSACRSCIKRKIPCEFSHTKRLLRRSTPGAGTGAPSLTEHAPTRQISSASTDTLYIDRILENPGLAGVPLNDECIFKTYDGHMTSSNLAVFTESRLRLISQRLGHNQVRDLVEKIWELLKERACKHEKNPNFLIPQNIPTTPCALPQVEAAGYVKAYFESVHPLYPFLDREEFERKVAVPNLMEILEEQPAFSALYHAVLALGCQIVGDVSFDPGVGRSWQIFKVSLAILPRILTQPDSESDLQAITAMAIFGMNIPGMQVDELFIEAVRKAARIGCHRVIKRRGLDPVSCYKAFWVIYVLERMLCFVYGMSPLLADYDIGCPLPETPESNVEGVNFFLMAVRCGRILSKAYQTLFSVSATMKSTEQYVVAIDAIKSDLSRWNYSIPAKYRPGMPFHTGNAWETLTFLRLHYMYHALNISLCRLELHVGVDQSTQRMNDTRKQLMNTARTVLDLTTFIELKPSTPMWIMCAIPASAMLILFDFVIHNPTHIETDTNLKILDTAAGFFGRIQYATGGSFPSMIMSGFAHIASDYVRRTRAGNSPSAPPANPTSMPGQSATSSIAASVPPSIPNFATSAELPGAGINGLPRGGQPQTSEVYNPYGPLFYPIEEGDYMMDNDLFAGLNFANFFDPVVPEY